MALTTDVKQIRRLAFWSILVSLFVMGIKFIAWWLTGSVALYSDALESIINVIASFVAWLAIGYAQRPADETHQFGHQKAEYFSAVVEGMLIVFAAMLIVSEAVGALLEPTLRGAPWQGIMINIVAGAINGFWAYLLISRGRKARSPALVADGSHILADVVTSVGVVAGLSLAYLTGYLILDPLLAIAVAINILFQGYKIISRSINALMDHALSEGEQALIRRTIAEHSKGAIEFHDLKTREAGSARFAEFHLVLDGEMSVEASHAICDRIEKALHEASPGIRVTIHVEPHHKSKPEEGYAI